MSAPVRIGIAGINGRMGREVAAIAGTDPRVTLIGGITRRQPERDDWPGALITTAPDHLLPEIDCLIDLTLPEATATLARAAASHRVPLLCGVTGLGSGEIAALDEAASVIPVHWARNLSRGLPLIARFARDLAAALGEWDVEIVETHHRGKREAPSGTALLLAESVAAGRGHDPDDRIVHGRWGEHLRQEGEIGLHALRAGGVPGEHTLLLADGDEEIRITHRALGRSAFAKGAIEAALGLIGRSPGPIRT